MSDQDKLIQNSLLFLAIRTKNLSSTQLGSIIEHGGDINAKDANDGNNTPLHVAVNSGDLEIVRLLLDQGAKVAEKNSSGQTPLEVAKGSAVVSLLQEYLPQMPEIKSPQESMQSTPQDSTPETKPFCYKKRAGTSGIGGQLYETKLLTLILFRALISTDIVEFYLGSNVDGLGALDDVVFWYRTRDDKTRLILIQAKHRDEPKKEGTLTLGGILKEKGDYSLHKYFASYLSIRRKFGSESENDPIFREEFGKVDCDYVLYTPARENFECKQSLDLENARFNTSQNDLLYSTDCGMTFKCHYSLEHVNILAEVASKFRYQSLGCSLADFILSDEKKWENMLSDNLIKTYQVVLVQKVFNISETGQASFKEDFFETTEKSLVVLREAMYDKVLENRKQSIRDTDLQNYTKALLENPSAENISKLLGIVIKCNSQTNTLEVIKSELDDLKNAVKTIIVTPEIIRKATEIVGQSELASLNFQPPEHFGNLDWPVRKNKIDRRMKHIVQKFKELFELATENRVRIDNSMVGSGKILNSGDVNQNGGLAGMVGNILVRDPNTNLLKFNCDENSLQPNAKKLLEMLKTEIGDALEHYRLDITIDSFPQLTLECNAIDEKLAKCFLDNMFFYTNQAKESEIDKILKDEIQVRYKISDPIFCDAVFSMVHDKVVNLWKQQGNVPYLTKNCDYFDKIVALVRDNPPLTNLSAICTLQINRFKITFNAASVEALASQIKGGVTNIISSHVEQCCIKLLQHFSADSRLFITEQYLQVALPYLRQMLQLKTGSDFWKILIIVGDQESIGGIKEIIAGMEKSRMQLIIITKERLISCDNTINYGGDVFTSLSAESQETLLKEREVFFPRTEIKLNRLVDDKLLGIIDAEMLSLLISKQDLCIAKQNESAKYKNIANFLIQRKLKRPVIKVQQGVQNTKSDVWVNSMDDFNSKCAENERINVHWVDPQGIWQKSRGSLKKVRALADPSSGSQFTVVESLDSLDERVVVIAAEPGMGKSTLMTELVERIKQRDPLSWVVRVDLLLFSDEFKKWNANIDLPLVLNFLLNVQNMLPSENGNLLTVSPNKLVMVEETLRNKISGRQLFEIELFLHYYNQGKLVFLFDGFDEISPNYKIQVLKLLKILQNYNSNKLWVTTRNDNNHYELEDSLSTFSFTLESFGQQDQVTYLQKYWTSTLMVGDAIDKARFELVFNKLMKLLSNAINEAEPSLMKIPLHIEMFARTFQSTFKLYYGGKPIEELEYSQIDVVMLYDRFFEIKFDEILYGDKAPSINRNDPKISDILQKERQAIVDKHEKLALCALFDDHELTQISCRKYSNAINSKYLKDIKSGREKVGLICQITNDKPRFVHQTFAEFFAARFLWRAFKSPALNVKSFVEIVTKSNRYQVCYFLQQIALKDINDRAKLDKLESKLCILLIELVPYLRNYSYFIRNGSLQNVRQNHYSIDDDRVQSGWVEYVANRCARSLLKIIESFIANRNHRVNLAIKRLDIEHRFRLLSTAACEGDSNLVQQFIGLLEPDLFCKYIYDWQLDPLLAAAANGHVNVVEILKKEFYHNVTTWIDKNRCTLKQHIFASFPVYRLHFVNLFAQTGLIDGSPYMDPYEKVERFPILNLLFENAPVHIVRMIAKTTDFGRLNKLKISEQDEQALHGLCLCLLGYDDELTRDFQNYGVDFSQSVNSLVSQYSYRTVAESEIIPDKLNLNDIYRKYEVWNNLFQKIKLLFKIGTGYNRKDSLYDVSTRKFIEQAYYIHGILEKLCHETQLADAFDTLLKLIIICLKRHTLYNSDTCITVLNNHVAISCLEFNKKFRWVFGSTVSLILSPFMDTKRFVIGESTISEMENLVEKYKTTLTRGEFPDHIYLDQFSSDRTKYDVISRIHEVVDFQNNCTFDEALQRVLQEMHRSRKRMIKIMEITPAKQEEDVKIFSTEQIFDVLELQDVKTTAEMEDLMTRIIDCNGLSLFTTLLYHISFDQEECKKIEKKLDNVTITKRPKRFVKDVITFSEQAPLIYNLWMKLDQQYQKLLQAIQTSNETVRNVLDKIDPDYRRAVINGQDPENGSPLHYAAAKGDPELVRTLLEFGADPNPRLDETGPVERLRIDDDDDDDGMDNFMHFMPLHFAAMRGFGEVVEVLLAKGAKADVLTSSGWLPVGLARKRGHESLVKLLGGKKD